MEYKLGIDRMQVSDDEKDFPYSLKLWHDKNNIYIKVLRLPKSLDEFPRKNEAWENFVPANFKLCVETLQTSSRHGCEDNGSGHYRYKFLTRYKDDTPMIHPVVGETYTFPIEECMTSLQKFLVKKNGQHIFLTVRGSLRYSPTAKPHGRTGIYSNTEKIIYY